MNLWRWICFEGDQKRHNFKYEADNLNLLRKEDFIFPKSKPLVFTFIWDISNKWVDLLFDRLF